jgi:hypothetical protein
MSIERMLSSLGPPKGIDHLDVDEVLLVIAANVTSLLRRHLRAGNIKRVSREVFAAVPAHLAADRMVIDRFAAARKLRSDGVLPLPTGR